MKPGTFSRFAAPRAPLSTHLALVLICAFPVVACSAPETDSAPKAPAAAKDDTAKAAPAAATAPIVVLTTNKGKIEVELNAEKAPISVANFLAYVDAGHYDGTVFHRVIKGFMIQGGGFTPDKQQKQGNPPIKNEADNGLKNDRGTLAMARTGVVDSATAQFFINTVDNAFLNHRSPSPQGFGYAVFGKVIDGMKVVDAIESSPKSNQGGPFVDAPNDPVIIEKASRK